VKELTGAATQVVPAPIDECFGLLEAVDRYPVWHPEVVRGVEVLERSSDGRPTRARTTLHVARGPLMHDFHLTMDVVADPPGSIALTRLGHEPADRELFEVRWRLSAENAGTRMALALQASLSVPRFLPLGGIGDELARGFVVAAASALRAERGTA
jgi:ribosome-associated toxin RatA of RatAB toxin-antitoxin module